MSSVDITELIDVHYRTHLGCYFDSVTRRGRIVDARSVIPGPIWNHVYVPGDSEVPLNDPLLTIRDRALYRDGATTPAPPGWGAVDEEVWMLLTNHRTAVNQLGIRIRQVGVDEPALQSLVTNAFDGFHARAISAAKSAEGVTREYFVAVDAMDRPVGAFSLHTLGSYTAIHDVCILNGRRGEGLGSELVGAIVGHVRELPFVYLQVEEGWVADFYGRYGFSTIHHRRGFARK